MAPADLELLFKWLHEPHVKKWWDTNSEWKVFEDRYNENISNPLVFPHFVYFNEKPIGYFNYWFVEDDPDFINLYPKETVGTDQLIGEAEFVGKGHGSKLIKQMTNELLGRPEINLLITDPHPDNLAAIRCYENAGFVKVKLMKSSDGPIQLMEKSDYHA